MDERKYFCRVDTCPGLPYKNSEHPHPCGQSGLDELRAAHDDDEDPQRYLLSRGFTESEPGVYNHGELTIRRHTKRLPRCAVIGCSNSADPRWYAHGTDGPVMICDGHAGVPCKGTPCTCPPTEQVESVVTDTQYTLLMFVGSHPRELLKRYLKQVEVDLAWHTRMRDLICKCLGDCNT